MGEQQQPGESFDEMMLREFGGDASDAPSSQFGETQVADPDAVAAEVEAAIVARTGKTMAELMSHYMSAYGGNPDRVAQALNDEVGDILHAAHNPPDAPRTEET